MPLKVSCGPWSVGGTLGLAPLLTEVCQFLSLLEHQLLSIHIVVMHGLRTGTDSEKCLFRQLR